MAAENKLRTDAYVLAARDLAAGAADVGDVLCLRLEWNEAAERRRLSRGGGSIMIGHGANETPAAAIGTHRDVPVWSARMSTACMTRSRCLARS